MEISATMVKELREKTGAGMMDCKKTLTEAQGNMEKAIELLRQKGLAAAAKRSGRIAAEGAIGSYVHLGGKIGVLVEVNCETDFVAKTDDFKELVRDIAMQIAASNPQYVVREEVPADIVEAEKKVLAGSEDIASKPEAMRAKIVEGRINKFFEQICLMEQPFVKEPSLTVGELINNKVAKVGEKLSIRRFTRYVLGEGLEKRQDDFAAEVMSQVQK
ncbi:MAG TPA: translation elongation factor Ts [Cyanobacteria bacterium UBA8530]|nr:translation elongation factor Ts [Cyanobacteria bacterium UBA8530]